MKSNEDAKAIFFAHNGDKHYMSINGMLDEYQHFNISENIEAEWRLALIHERFLSLFDNKFDLNATARFGNLVQLLIRTKKYVLAVDAIRYLEENIDKYDSFASILLLESSLELMEEMKDFDIYKLCQKLILLNMNIKNKSYEIREKPTYLSTDDVSCNAINKRINDLNVKLQELLRENSRTP